MIYVDDFGSFVLGLAMGVTGTVIFGSFAAFLVVQFGSQSDKRGLSGRHRPEGLGATELSGPPLATLPVLARRRPPQASFEDQQAPGSSPVAPQEPPGGPEPTSHYPVALKSRRSRPAGPHGR